MARIDTTSVCELAGARLGAAHQPQQVGNLWGLRFNRADRYYATTAIGRQYSRAPAVVRGCTR